VILFGHRSYATTKQDNALRCSRNRLPIMSRENTQGKTESVRQRHLCKLLKRKTLQCARRCVELTPPGKTLGP
jgi:hypothetical protein